MKVVFFGLSITSSWGNGHATTYRALLKALAGRGHSVFFIEKDRSWYRDHRDLQEANGYEVVVYDEWEENAQRLLAICADADVVVIGSYYPDAIVATRMLLSEDRAPLFFYDIDTPVTMAQLRSQGATDYLDTSLIAHYDAYLSFSGGPILHEIESRYCSPRAVAFYCSVDPDKYFRREERSSFRCDLSYLGTYAADRQGMLMKYLDGPARHLAAQRFLVAGPQYPDDIEWAPNVERLEHVAPPEHPAFYSSSRFTLNLTRQDMVAAGFSPSVRLFEAAACGTAIITDRWAGLDTFFMPGDEVLIPQSEAEIVNMLTEITDAERRQIGERARERVLAEHTAEKRAEQFEQIVASCRQRHPAPFAAATSL